MLTWALWAMLSDIGKTLPRPPQLWQIAAKKADNAFDNRYCRLSWSEFYFGPSAAALVPTICDVTNDNNNFTSFFPHSMTRSIRTAIMAKQPIIPFWFNSKNHSVRVACARCYLFASFLTVVHVCHFFRFRFSFSCLYLCHINSNTLRWKYMDSAGSTASVNESFFNLVTIRKIIAFSLNCDLEETQPMRRMYLGKSRFNQILSTPCNGMSSENWAGIPTMTVIIANRGAWRRLQIVDARALNKNTIWPLHFSPFTIEIKGSSQ